MDYYLLSPNQKSFNVENPSLQNMFVVWSDKGLCCLDTFHYSRSIREDGRGSSFLARLSRIRGHMMSFVKPSSSKIDELEKLIQNYNFDPLYPLDLVGTPFQIEVWNEIRKQTGICKPTTYKEVADAIGSKAYRAVGTACANNNILGFIPCHRVFPQTSNRFQYKWGIELRAHILDKEREIARKGSG